MPRPITGIVGVCCVLGGSALSVDHRTSTAGCTSGDWGKFSDHFDKQRVQLSSIQPQLEEAYKQSDISKAYALMSKVTPQYCGQSDLLQMDSFPPTLKFSSLQKCIRKSQGVSVACASCFPTYLESMMGKNGVMASHSCLTKCSKVTPTTAQCLARFQDPQALRACLKPEVQKNSIPCLECSKPRLVAYTNCLNMKFLNAEAHLNSVISTIRGDSAVAILNQASVGGGGNHEGHVAEFIAGAAAVNGTAQEKHTEHGGDGSESKDKSRKKRTRKAKNQPTVGGGGNHEGHVTESIAAADQPIAGSSDNHGELVAESIAAADQPIAGSSDNHGEHVAESVAGADAVNGTTQEEHAERRGDGSEGKGESRKKRTRKVKKHHAKALVALVHSQLHSRRQT